MAQPIPSFSRTLKRSTLSEQHLSESTTLDGVGSNSLLLPSRSEGTDCPVSCAQGEPRRRWSSIQTASDAWPLPAGEPALDLDSEPVPHGTAEVFANTRTRCTGSGFEILPAGSLGTRLELHPSVRPSEEASRPTEEARTPNKLQKPRPKDLR